MNFPKNHSGSRQRPWPRAIGRGSLPPQACWRHAHLSFSGCWNEFSHLASANCKAGVGDPHPPWRDPFGQFRRKSDFGTFDEFDWRAENELELSLSSGLTRHWSCWPYNFDSVTIVWYSCFDRDSHCEYRRLLNFLLSLRTAMCS